MDTDFERNYYGFVKIKISTMYRGQVAVVIVPFPAQGHINQLLQLSCLISSYGIPVHYVGSSTHNRQATSRINGLNPVDIMKIRFHDLPTPAFVSPAPDPNAPTKFPAHLQPCWDASVNLREPVAALLKDISSAARRVIVIHDPLMSIVVQDVASIPTAESYVFNCFSALSQLSFFYESTGKQYPKEAAIFGEIPIIEGCLSNDILKFTGSQFECLKFSSGDIHNTCRLIEGSYFDLLAQEEICGNKRQWAVGPILSINSFWENFSNSRTQCLKWLDDQPPNSVIYVCFGTTTTMSDEQMKELAIGLEQSRQRFIWVLRDADKGDIFTGEARINELPEGFEARMKDIGLVVRDWAPQPQILAHPSTGGFMSHCGWNSCLESIAMGVPIAAWPMHSDQPKNTLLLTEVLRVGLPVRDWNCHNELVSSSAIEKVVKRLMASEEGVEIRKRAKELGNAVRLSTEEGGVSRVELDSFVAHITR